MYANDLNLFEEHCEIIQYLLNIKSLFTTQLTYRIAESY